MKTIDKKEESALRTKLSKLTALHGPQISATGKAMSTKHMLGYVLKHAREKNDKQHISFCEYYLKFFD